MIADHIIKFVVDKGKAMEAKNVKINFSHIRAKIYEKWHEDYPEKMLERLFWHERDNPKWKQKEVKADYIDLKTQVEAMQAEMKRKLGDKS